MRELRSIKNLHKWDHRVWSQSTHRMAMATFWRTFHHDGKISPGWWGWGVHAPTPFHYIYHHVQSCGVQYVPADRVDTLPLLILYPYMYSVDVISISRAGHVCNACIYTGYSSSLYGNIQWKYVRGDNSCRFYSSYFVLKWIPLVRGVKYCIDYLCILFVGKIYAFCSHILKDDPPLLRGVGWWDFLWNGHVIVTVNATVL